jgi:endonuclease VIII
MAGAEPAEERTMPEGDTVWLTARRLDQALSGTVLTVSDFRVPDFAEVDLTGRRVTETVSRGKHLLTRVEDVTIHSHLKMEGSWHIYRVGTPWRSPAFQARVVLGNSERQAVGFRLGRVEVIPRREEDTVVGHLGPDLLGSDWSPDEAVRRLRSHALIPIGEALLDQRNLAGVGNMYKCEVCFLMGVHPGTPVGDIDCLPQLVTRVRQLLDANKARADQSTTGDLRRGHELWVYGRRGRPCRRCGTKIKHETLPANADRERRQSPGAAPDQDRARESFWCPRCQPGRPS